MNHLIEGEWVKRLAASLGTLLSAFQLKQRGPIPAAATIGVSIANFAFAFRSNKLIDKEPSHHFLEVHQKSRSNKMKKQMIAIGLLAVVSYSGLNTLWAFESRVKRTVTASVTTGGTKDAAFNMEIRNVTDPEGANQAAISWTGVTAGVTGWKIANQLIRLRDILVTDAAGGIQIYTDNKNAPGTALQPRYVDPVPGELSNPGGLLLANGSQTTSFTLPLAWSIKDESRIVEGVDTDPNVSIGAADPNNGPEGAVSNNKFQWLFLLDKQDPAQAEAPNFAPGPTFAQMVRSTGLHFGQRDDEFGSNSDRDAYVYLQANFGVAGAGEDYITSTLTIEAYRE